MVASKVAEEMGVLTYLGEGEFRSLVCADDHFSYETLTDFTGRTWKEYWLYWDASNGLCEYGGVELRVDEVEKLGAGTRNCRFCLTTWMVLCFILHIYAETEF